MTNELVNVSDLNQYQYCSRRYWYLHFYDTQGRNYYRIDGKTKHENSSRRGGWTRELYLESEALGLKGKIDVLELDGELIPIERKRGDQHWYNDELQLAGYCLLLEEQLDEPVYEGAIYLYDTDQRMHVTITEQHKTDIRERIDAMRSMTVDDVPPLTDNPNKCEKCSTREYCLPAETAKLEPQKAEGSGWEDHL